MIGKKNRNSAVLILISFMVIITGCGSGSGGVYNYTGDWEYDPPAASSKIADHSAARLPVLESIPDSAINNAKSNLVIAFGHTSHGSQIVDGLSGLVAFMNGKGKTANLYSGLNLKDDMGNYGSTYGASDLNQPNYTAWESATRSYLAAHTDINVVIWSWCGGADTSESNITNYLTLMSGLETSYPAVKFVYMTGHLNGGGLTGNLHIRNEQIRKYCRDNNKYLFDFADIETYGPDGTYYGNKYPTDGCNYDYNGDDTTSQTGDPAQPVDPDRNWAKEWRDAHTEDVDWYSCSSAHSDALNANMKTYAFWWLMARLGGWGG